MTPLLTFLYLPQNIYSLKWCVFKLIHQCSERVRVPRSMEPRVQRAAIYPAPRTHTPQTAAFLQLTSQDRHILITNSL